MALKFLTLDSRSFVLNTIDGVISQQVSKYKTWSVKFTPTDFLCLSRNNPVKIIQYNMFSNFKDIKL